MSIGQAYSLNAVPRGVYIADNLPFLLGLNDACIDLVCIDPPFSRRETVLGTLAPPLSEAEKQTELRLLGAWGVTDVSSALAQGIVWPEDIRQGGYKNIWSWENYVHQDWLESIKLDWPGVNALIEATRLTHSEGAAAYLCYMAVRVIQIHRVLKPTGTLYLHCDHTANAYLRQLLDAVFGEQNFRNEIIWHYGKMSNVHKIFPQNHDTILRYTKTDQYTFHVIKGAESEYKQRFQRYLTGNKVLYGAVKDSKDKLVKRRVAKRTKEMNRQLNNDDVLFDFDGEDFKVQSDVICVPILKGNAKERTGYPTQKPVALAEKIIESSSNTGDVVLDCFAGCSYVAVAAERLNRLWVACDFNPRAWTVFKRQFSKPTVAVLNCEDMEVGQTTLPERIVTVYGPHQIPVRVTPTEYFPSRNFDLPERKFKVPASVMSESEMLTKLLELSGYQAWCCGYANRMPDGEIVETTRNFHLDHMEPKSRDGVSEIYNRAPLCPHHNIRKNNRRIYLADYRKEIADAGELMVASMDDLINLQWANQQAHEIWYQARQSKENA